MYFKEIPGNEDIKNRLRGMVRSRRVSHALLFHGPEGNPKLPLALAFAGYLCCQERTEEDACGKCPSCIKFNKYIHPDLHLVFPSVSKSGESGEESFIAEFRDMLIENPYTSEFEWYRKLSMENRQGLISKADSDNLIKKLGLKSYESDFKVAVLWLPERMNPTSANRLLKLIEEPPAKTVFLLVSENPDQIMATILSRTQLISVPRFSDDEIAILLKQKSGADDKGISDAVHQARGNFNTALQAVLEGDQDKDNFERFVQLMRLGFRRDIVGLTAWVDDIAGLGREKQKNFLEYSIKLLRENYILNMGLPGITNMMGFEDEFSRKFSAFIHERNITEFYTEFNLAWSHISANGYARIVFLDLCLKIVKYLQM